MVEVVFFEASELNIYGLKHLFGEIVHNEVTFSSVDTLQELRKFLSKHPKAKVVLNANLPIVDEQLTQIILLREQYINVSWLLLFDEIGERWLKTLVNQKESYFSAVYRSDTLEILKEAIRDVVVSRFFISKTIQTKIDIHHEIVSKVDGVLTTVERLILKEIANGKMTKEIALDRNVSVHTITTHRKNIFKKLGVNSIHEATVYAIKSGIIVVNDYFI